VRKTTITLADGRELSYFGALPSRPTDYQDRRTLPPALLSSQARRDRLLDEWVVVASHRQERTFRPADDQCPLCPSSAARLTEIPAPEYDVVVFENRFPTLPAMVDGKHGGRCEVICFSQQHDTSFADLTAAQAAMVMAAWLDRSTELARMPGVEQVYCFENRGQEIGVTLAHPHGQIYAYPYVTPRTSRMLRAAADHWQATGRNLFDEVLSVEREQACRIVLDGSHWTAFVPYAARWPYEVHIYPHRRVPDLAALTDEARSEFGVLYIDLLRRFDRLFDAPAPYISGWHQAPVRVGREQFALHLELFTIRRAPGKLKYLAGSEAGMGAFANDVTPEAAAKRLRDLA
jgi:UDPglucose--hexose-1-phosphate uridylyltransferase